MNRTCQAIALALFAVVFFCRPARAQYSCGSQLTCESHLDFDSHNDDVYSYYLGFDSHSDEASDYSNLEEASYLEEIDTCGEELTCVSYLDFDSYNDEVYGYSYTEDTYDSGDVVGVETDFNGTTGEDDGEYYWAEVDIDQPYANGVYYLNATHYWDVYVAGTTSAAVSGYFSPPSGETTAFEGWDDADSESAIGLWLQTLGGSQNYSGLQVQETSGGTGSDGCYNAYPNGVIPPFTTITGGDWTVSDSNQWGDDNVGWLEFAVSYYRTAGAAPCTTTFYQQMQIQNGPGAAWVNYRSANTLTATIGTTTVGSGRSGSSQTRSY